MIVTTLAGAVVGALIGSVGTHLLQVRRQREQENQKIVDLRNSLLAELSCMDDLLRSDYDDTDDAFPVGMAIPSEIFESNSGHLSILTQKETERVIRFYSGALKYQKMVEEATNLFLNSNKSPEDILEERKTKPRIREEWIRCVNALLEESDTYPDAIEFEGRKIEPHEDVLFEDLWIFLNHAGINEKGMQAEPIHN